MILEPAAVLDLVGQMFGDFSATAIATAAASSPIASARKLFGENITFRDDVAHPLQSGAPFDGEGVPRRKLTLVEAGVPREIAYSRPAPIARAWSPPATDFRCPTKSAKRRSTS